MAVAENQLEFNGLVIGDGTDYGVRSIEGLASASPVRGVDQIIAGRHGQHPLTDWVDARVITMSLVVTNRSALAALASAFRPATDELPLSFRIAGIAEGGTRRVSARVKRHQMTTGIDFISSDYAEPVFQFVATDPRIYADTQSTVSTLPASTGGGLEEPFVEPFVFTVGGTSGVATATNAGNFPTPVALSIAGPLSGEAEIQNVTTGRSLVLVGTSVAAGDFVALDSAARTVLLNGTANRYSWVDLDDSSWFDLEPGANELRFFAPSSPNAQLTATWRSAWIA